MNCLFLRRGYPDIVTGIAVTVTGTGNASGSYAVIGGVTVIAAGDYTVQAGDVITFGVSGTRFAGAGIVTIDGTTVARSTTGKTVTYNWTVPSDIGKIAIALTYASAHGTITVTTS